MLKEEYFLKNFLNNILPFFTLLLMDKKGTN